MRGALPAALVVGLAWGGAAQARGQIEPTTEIALHLGASTEYVFRGVGQTGGQPQVFGGADLARGPAYFGVWASNVDYADGTEAELDLYGGFRRELGGWTLDVGAVAYLYPGQPEGAGYDYVEAKMGASRAFGAASLAGTVFWTPDFGGSAGQGTYAELSASYTPVERWTVSGAVGRQALARSESDYVTWNLGLSWAATRQLVVDVRYHDTNAGAALGSAYDGRVNATLKTTF